MSSHLFCVTGWHYPVDFYQTLLDYPAADIVVISHQHPSNVPDKIKNLVSQKNILYRSNIGYDWGCYQQFLNSGIWRDYPEIYFMHDDIKIHSFGFVEKVNRLLKEHSVIGNGFGEGNVSLSKVRDRLPAYAHSSWKPASLDFQHQTVRGSFFATTRETLQRIGFFEVYWDPWKINIGFGNWSTKATCGKLEELFGPACFGYLSNTFGRSEYITEFIRGEEEGGLPQISGWRYHFVETIKRASRVYLEILYREKEIPARQVWLFGLKWFLGFFSRKLY